MLREAWGEISSDYLNKLTTTMTKVCKAVIAANEDSLTKAKFEGHNYYFNPKSLFITLSMS
jgi:hypothetical protein